ncbi:MAG TPA: ABC transporter substrate-binding protein [Thermomicrobiales bacterium]|nr:ABC transporter substrate-binding protein [Thermomicrobiales bacterium]
MNQTNATPASGGTPAAKPAQYKEAPALADMVKAGKLPPVEKRLPDNPRVLKPLQEVGQYGGTWHRAYTGLSDRVGPTKLGEEMLIEWDAPDPNTINIIANVVEKWEQNSDASEYTFHLRKGMKWSDGQDVTTDDAKFWFEDVQLNKDITPAPNFAASQNISGQIKLATLTVVDAQTFKMKYAAPYPLLPITIAKLNGDFILPMHYLKNYHPKYTSMDQLNKVVADKKVTTWTELWGKAGDGQGPIYFWFVNPDLPMIRNWTMTVVPPADPIVAVRNPYYWQVDTDGNQLPYIDKVEHVIYQSNDVLNLKIASGQIDMQMRHLDAGSYTFYKENEQKGGYKTFKWRAASTNAYFPNINCPDPVLAKLFDTPEFRQALNIAIDRKKINDLVWNGLGSPRQTAPVKGSPEYDPDLEKAWTEYNPDQANSLLDKIGLTKNPDGSRKRSDGKPLEITVEHTTIAGSPEDDQHQRVKAYWEAIGVKTNMKYVERSLYEEHVHNAEVQLGYWGFDRCSVVKADPGRFLGTIDDGPWAPAFGHWYAQSPYKKTEPPQDHPIRDIWKNWEATAAEPDEAKRKADFQKILDIWKQHPYAVGVVGEMVVPMVVRNNFRNILDGYIDDDTLRDSGLLNPQQFYLKQS